jgi:3-deoxy-D-manno-octulosonic-acid transferase
MARVAARVAPTGDSKVLRALGGRRGIRQRYRAWAAAERDTDRPLLWMHAPSVGEGLQARPVLQLMRARRPEAQLAYTHFSPSAAAFARGLDVDFRDYLVFDTAGDTALALDALAPTALVFAKLDVWPTLVRVAHERGVRLGLVSATVSTQSSRRSGIGRAISTEAFRRLDAVGAVDDGDAERLVEMGVRPAVIEVTGDTRYDQVWQRAQQCDRQGGVLASLRSPRPTVVAGSTWPSDEAALLPAFIDARRTTPELRLIIAPHEPTAAHCSALESWAVASGLAVARIDTPGAASADVIVIDRVGILGDVYAAASIAFVGGGFHAAGLHSVLEPAAFGVPVLVGPRFQRSRDAVLLVRRGGAVSVDTAAQLSAQLDAWLADAVSLTDAGARARALVRSGLGAAERSFTLVNRLMA